MNHVKKRETIKNENIIRGKKKKRKENERIAKKKR